MMPEDKNFSVSFLISSSWIMGLFLLYFIRSWKKPSISKVPINLLKRITMSSILDHDSLHHPHNVLHCYVKEEIKIVGMLPQLFCKNFVIVSHT